MFIKKSTDFSIGAQKKNNEIIESPLRSTGLGPSQPHMRLGRIKVKHGQERLDSPLLLYDL